MTAREAGLLAPTFPLVLAAPSGAGKTTIARTLRERRDDVAFSISATTRPARPGERDGVDYHFVAGDEFRRMAAAGELIEWAEVHGNLYGTPRRNVDEAVARGEHLLLDIDVQGARQIRERVPEAVLVFVLPPDGRTLAERLVGRASDDPEVRARRLRNADREVAAAPEFDYLVVNDRLEEAVDAVEAILAAEARRAARMPELDDALARMRAEIRSTLAPPAGGARTHEDGSHA